MAGLSPLLVSSLHGLLAAAVEWLAGILLVATAVLLLYALWRARTAGRPAVAGGSQTLPPPSWDYLWVVVPLAILACIFVALLVR